MKKIQIKITEEQKRKLKKIFARMDKTFLALREELADPKRLKDVKPDPNPYNVF